MPEPRIIIEHKDGRTYSVTRAAHAKLYPDFKIVGDENDDSFVPVGVPKPKRQRSKPKAKAPLLAPPETLNVEDDSEGEA